MFTLISAWIGARIITVTMVTVVAVAAIPTTLVIVSHDRVTVTVSQQQQHQQQVTLIAAVKKAGDAAILKLTAAEHGCTVQIDQTVANAHLTPVQVQTQLAQAKTQLHGSVVPFITAIRTREDHVAHLKVVTLQDEQNEEHEINLIVLTALGQGQTPGTITVTCQTVTVVIQQVIQVIVLEQQVQVVHVPSRDGDD